MAASSLLEYRGPRLGGGSPVNSTGRSLPFALGFLGGALASAASPPLWRSRRRASRLRFPSRSPSVIGFFRHSRGFASVGSSSSSCRRFSRALRLKGRACRSSLDGISGYEASLPSSFFPSGRSYRLRHSSSSSLLSVALPSRPAWRCFAARWRETSLRFASLGSCPASRSAWNLADFYPGCGPAAFFFDATKAFSCSLMLSNCFSMASRSASVVALLRFSLSSACLL